MSELNMDSKFKAYASDIDPEVLEKAKENAERAGVADYIEFFEADA